MKKLPHYRWFILFTAWFSFLSTQIVRYVIPPLIPVLRQSLNLTDAQAGFVVAIFWVPYAGTQFIAGLISDKIGVRKTQVIALGMLAVFTILLGFSTGFEDLLIFRLLQGFASGFIFAPGMALLLRWFETREKNVASSLYVTATTLGPTIPLFSSAILAALLGWRSFFWLSALIPIVAAGVAIIFVKESPSAPKLSQNIKTERKTGQYLKISLSVLRNKHLWYNSAATFGSLFAFQAAATWAASYAVDRLGFTLALAGLIASSLTIGALLGNVAGGVIPDKIIGRNGHVAMVGMVATGLISIILGASPNLTMYSIIVLFLSLGFSYGLTSPTLNSMIAELVADDKAYGAAAGLKNTLGHSGSAIAISIFGILLGTTGSYVYPWITLGVVSLMLSLSLLPLILAGY